MRAYLANPRGFCAGVDRAIEIVERALAIYGAPVYVLHEIVHNRHVLDNLHSRGVHFVAELDDIPSGAVTIFSAHGVSDEVERAGSERGLKVIDATCPLVTKVHLQARRYAGENRELILIGHGRHPEVEGTRGRFPGTVHVLSTPEEVEQLEVRDPDHLAYVTQTTLSIDDTREVIDALVRRFPTIEGPELADICYATQSRQDAVRRMSRDVDLLIVVGSSNSSNSNRLRELGERAGIRSFLVDESVQIDPSWFEGIERVGVTAGASAPEELVQEILVRLGELGVESVEEFPGEEETVLFKLPAELGVKTLRVAWRLPAAFLIIGGSMILLALARGWRRLAPGVGRGFEDRVLRRGAGVLARAIGMRVTGEGPPPRGAFLLVTNHLSYIDIIALMSVVDARFLSRADVAHWPLIGAVTRFCGTVYIDRSRRGDLPRVIAKIEETMIEGRGVVFFPEGTSSPGVEVLPFKPSLFEVAASGDLPVRCGAISHRAPAGERPAQWSVCWWGTMEFFGHLLGLLRLPGFETRIVFSDRSVRDRDRKRLSTAAHEIVTGCFTPLCTAEELAAEEPGVEGGSAA